MDVIRLEFLRGWGVVIINKSLFFFLLLFLALGFPTIVAPSLVSAQAQATKTSAGATASETPGIGTGLSTYYQIAFEIKLRLSDTATSKIKNLFVQNPELAQRWKIEVQIDNKPVVALQLPPVTSFGNASNSNDALSQGLGAISGNPTSSFNRDYGLFQLLAQVEGSRRSGQLVLKDQTGSVVGRQPLSWSVPPNDYSLSGTFLFDQISQENARMDSSTTVLKAGLPVWAADLSGQLSASALSNSEAGTQMNMQALPNPFMLLFFSVLFGGVGSLILINGFQVGLLQFKFKTNPASVPSPATSIPTPAPRNSKALEKGASESESKKKFKFGKGGSPSLDAKKDKPKKIKKGDKGTVPASGIFVGVAKGTGTGKGDVVIAPEIETEGEEKVENLNLEGL